MHQNLKEMKDKMEKALIIEKVFKNVFANKNTEAKELLKTEYPFQTFEVEKRNYNVNQKIEIFMKDGFIDRYSGERLLNPGVLKILSFCFPAEFPYHSHWKMTDTHVAYWELIPTIDHIYPIARGGVDDPSNWVTTSMLHNQVKNNWTLDQLNWKLHDAGDIKNWDGLSYAMIEFLDTNKEYLEDSYIMKWYRATQKYYNTKNSL